MKRFVRCVCVFLIAVFFLGLPALAVEESEMRASDFFMSNSQYLYKTSDTSFDICYDVSAVTGMDELGASKVVLQRSSDGSSWSDLKTYKKADYSEMIDYGTGFHACSFSYEGSKGYYYKATVRFYAKNASGSAEFTDYTKTLKL